MEAGIFTSYDEVPYDVLPCTASHPSRLAAAAAVMGLPAPPIGRCRILDLGCGVGANALPIAADLPDAEVVAIDLSERQIELATRAAAELGLRNVDFRRLDILDVGPALGDFDYVIAHGIYSWVPAAVRDKTLAICAERLTPHGLAYVSHNALPGWHVVNVLREFALFHLRDVTSPAARVAGLDAAFGLLRDAGAGLASAVPHFIGEYAAAYGGMLSGVGGNRSAAVHHDLLNEINQPFHVRDVAAHAARHGLQHVTDAARWHGIPAELPADVRARVEAAAHDPIELQQYLDFLTMRTLRQTIFSRAGAPVARAPDPARLGELYVRTPLRPVSARPEVQGPKVERFAVGAAERLRTAHPITKAALCHLAAEAPRPIRFDALVDAAGAAAGQPATPADVRELARTVLEAAVAAAPVAFLHATAPPVTGRVLERPVARALARWQLRTTPAVTNHHHEPVTVEQLAAGLLPLLDGTRDRAALLEWLVAEAGTARLVRNGKPVPPPQVRNVLARDLDATLQQLAQQALLTAPA